MPFSSLIGLLFLIAAVLGVASFVQRSRKLAYMASGALVLGLAFVALLVLSLNSM